MNKLKIVMLLAVVVLGCNLANAITAQEKAAQTGVANYLTKQGFKIEIDHSDESVNFEKGDVMYWITFKNTEKGLLYTLHRRPIKLRGEKDDDDKANRKHERAVYACNEINQKNPYKAEVRHGRVDFTFPMFAASTADYCDQLGNIIGTMSKAKQDFDKAFDSNRVVTDSVHNYWANEDPKLSVLPQGSQETPEKNTPGIIVSKVSFGSVSYPENGKVLVDFDNQLNQNLCQYLTEKITLRATEAGTYYIGLKLYNPQGQLIVPNKNAKYTTVTRVDVKKVGKDVEVELYPFGTSNSKFWKKGVYTYEIYDANIQVRKDVFSIN